jgi:UDP-glucose 4-epimerase
MNIAITGISGYFGQIISSRLDIEKGLNIIGLDITEPKLITDELKYFKMDVRDPKILNVLRENSIDVMIHLVFMMPPIHNRRKAYDINVNGARNVLSACAKANVKKIIVASSTAVYGAHPDNPDWLTEDSPLRGNPDFYYSVDKLEVERLCSQYVREHQGFIVTLLRPCDVYGPSANFALSRALERKKVYLFEGFDPQYQFIHEEDLAEAFVLAIKKDAHGISNITPDGTISLSEAAKLIGRKVKWVRLTRSMAMIMKIMWVLHLSDWSLTGSEFWKYRWTASNEKAKRALGFHPKHTSSEAFLSKYKP